MSSRSSYSTNSSIGDGTSSYHSRSTKHSASSVSSRHASSVPTVPPKMMNGIERLQHIRNALTRISYIAEKDLHMGPLDPHASNVHDYFHKLREKIPKLQYNPKKEGGRDEENPQATYHKYLQQELQKLSSGANALLAQAHDETASTPDTYAGLLYHHLRELQPNFDDALALLSAKPNTLPSRLNLGLLSDQVAFHINDFDQFHESRLPRFLTELLAEGSHYAGVVSDLGREAAPVGALSVMVLEAAIGVRPGRSAHPVLLHLKKAIEVVSSRLNTATTALQLAGASTMEERDSIFRDGQLREYTKMNDQVKKCESLHTQISARWADIENRTEANALSRQYNLNELLQSKKISELQIIEEAQRAHDELIHACLPFVSPQYCRRNSLSYTQPCMIRLGFRVFDRDSENTLIVPTLSPHFFGLMRAESIALSDYERMAGLFSSANDVWIEFGDIPEMVKGARCALRGVHERLDHHRALEEQKEVGGYFIMNGGERILRALLMQRCNVGINIHRDKFVTQGPNFSAKAVVFRSKRPSGMTLQNYFYYTSVGEVVFSFARKVVWHIPVTLLLFCMKSDLTPMMLFKYLTVGMNGSPQHEARVEALLQHHRSKPYGDMDHMISYLSVLGRMFRQYNQQSNSLRFLPQFHAHLQPQHDAWYGLFLIRRQVLPHINCLVPTPDLPPSTTDFSHWLPQEIVAELEAKFTAMMHTVRQLYHFVDGKGEHQGNDVPAYQEVFTVSQVLVGAFEVCLNKFLKSFSYRLGSHYTPQLLRSLIESHNASFADCEIAMKQLRHLTTFCVQREAGAPTAVLNRLLITGNFTLDHDEDFYNPQTSGWVVMAEHLNFFRFFEQLRCLHRGKTIAGMRSSEVRKYPCEAYGFICMVHSPDGEDCGVLNHMSLSTVVSESPFKGTKDPELLSWLRTAVPTLISHNDGLLDRLTNTVPVWLDGVVIGYLPSKDALSAARNLRHRKAIRNQKIVDTDGVVRRADISPLNCLEVVYVPLGSKDPAGLYLFVENGRLMRPVQQVESSLSDKEVPFPIVFVGTWEQSWLDIASVPTDLIDAKDQLGKKFEFMEQNGSNIISLTSTTIPFFEYNCSPRNLFQCGLSKQSAGTQLQAQAWRREPKLFRMYTPQRYICRTIPMDTYGLDDVTLGVNAVIAVLAYTGYDLDDAVILNHTAQERGMLSAGITVGKVIHPSKTASDGDVAVFHNIKKDGTRESGHLWDNGLPRRRAPITDVSFDCDHKYPALTDETPVYCSAIRSKYTDPLDGTTKYRYMHHSVTRWRSFDKGENAWVQQVIPLTFDGPDVTSALVVFRIPRPPTVGDKFSSRHGQKGTLPLHIRAIDLPFSTRTGLTPDVIINPHAFPSRMTVGMILEIMGAKMGAIHGRFVDNSAWSVVGDEPRLAEAFGDALMKCGYDRYGREQMIDGISGEIMEADVFMGMSGYQRLRHMVSDKWQARPRTDSFMYRAVTKTGQPVKGRKRHGGVRVGEMERDGLLSHGIAEVVLDRLLHVSDKTKAFICVECGGLLSVYEKFANRLQSWKACRYCGAGSVEHTDTIAMIEIPQVLKLWATELTSIGIRVTMGVS